VDHALTHHMVLLAASVSPSGKDLIVKIQLYIEVSSCCLNVTVFYVKYDHWISEQVTYKMIIGKN